MSRKAVCLELGPSQEGPRLKQPVLLKLGRLLEDSGVLWPWAALIAVFLNGTLFTFG